jgi:hypothetical protein
MKVRVGVTLDGSPVVIDTAGSSVVVLVGDAGAGKTTIARYIARWWVADPTRTARVLAARPHEYRDLPVEVRGLDAAHSTAPTSAARGLTVVDSADDLAHQTLRDLMPAQGLLVVTSAGPAAHVLGRSAQPYLALLHRALPEADRAQGRLDWPSEAVPVIADERGARDLLPHRWAPGRLAG